MCMIRVHVSRHVWALAWSVSEVRMRSQHSRAALPLQVWLWAPHLLPVSSLHPCAQPPALPTALGAGKTWTEWVSGSVRLFSQSPEQDQMSWSLSPAFETD